jgi:trypsin
MFSIFWFFLNMGRWRNVFGVCLVLVVLVHTTIADDDAAEAETEAEEVNPEPLEYLPRYPHPHHDDNDVVDWMPRIIGGVHADIGEFPAKVSVQSRPGAHFCGGTLLDQSHVLTAAHCVTNDQGVVFDPNAIRLMGDDVSITPVASRSRQIRFASHIFVHPRYSSWTMANDIAVVRVSVQFTRTTTFQPLNMNQHSPVPDTMVSESEFEMR